MGFLIQDAFAQAPQSTPADPLLSMLPLVAIFAVFYFFLIRPQSKRQKEHKEMVAQLATGDEVVTAGGVLGRVTQVGEQFLEIEIASGVTVKVQRHTISAVVPKGTIKSA
jgi:preprotein translocase subunit YajC